MHAKMIASTAVGSVMSRIAGPHYALLPKPRRSIVGALVWIAFATVVIANAGHSRLPPSGVTTCRIIQHAAALGPQAEAKMRVGSGIACPVPVELILDTVKSVSVVAEPQSGSLSVVGDRVLYKSDPQFKGQDSFAFAVQGTLRSEALTVTVHVKTTVE